MPNVPYILVADDDPEDQEMLAERFKRRNPTAWVKLLGSAYEALDYLDACTPEELPQLIVTDYKMPGLTGAEFIGSLQKDDRYRHIHKIVWSTSNNQEYVGLSLKSGADRYFTKPNSVKDFDKIVDFLTQLFRSASRDPNL